MKKSQLFRQSFENTCVEVKSKDLVCTKNKKYMRISQKQELSMYRKVENTCEQVKKQKLGMYNKSENTYLKAKNNDPACMITGKTHA